MEGRRKHVLIAAGVIVLVSSLLFVGGGGSDTMPRSAEGEPPTESATQTQTPRDKDVPYETSTQTSSPQTTTQTSGDTAALKLGSDQDPKDVALSFEFYREGYIPRIVTGLDVWVRSHHPPNPKSGYKIVHKASSFNLTAISDARVQKYIRNTDFENESILVYQTYPSARDSDDTSITDITQRSHGQYIVTIESCVRAGGDSIETVFIRIDAEDPNIAVRDVKGC